MFARRHHANHFTRRLPIDVVPGTKLILFRDGLRQSDLVFGSDLRHILTVTRMRSLFNEPGRAAAEPLPAFANPAC